MPKKKVRSKRTKQVSPKDHFLKDFKSMAIQLLKMNEKIDMIVSKLEDIRPVETLIEGLRLDIKLEILERVGKWGAVLDRRIDGIQTALKNRHEFWGEYDRKN